MKLDGRRESTNVDDRRGGSTIAKAGGIGLGGIIIVGLITLLMGGDPTDVIRNVQEMGGAGTIQVDPNWQPSPEEEELDVEAPAEEILTAASETGEGEKPRFGYGSLEAESEAKTEPAAQAQTDAAGEEPNIFEQQLTLCRSITDYIHTMQEFVYLVRDVVGLYLCLYENWASGDTPVTLKTNTDHAPMLCYRIISQIQPLNYEPQFFLRDQLFPEHLAGAREQNYLYFAPIFFAGRELGHFILQYDKPVCPL